jgi:hypothetical protein
LRPATLILEALMSRPAFHAPVGVSLLLAACSSPLAPIRDADPASQAWLTASPAAAISRIESFEFVRSNECTGENVKITGSIHFVSQTQPDGGIVGHFNYQHVTGTGLTSGTEYRVSAVDQVHLSPPFPSSIHSVRSFRMIAPGPGNDLLVNALMHITVTANGDVSASIEELSNRCVGE